MLTRERATRRTIERLEELYRIGGVSGANRLGGSPEEDAAHELVAGWMEEEGLGVERDPAGNLYGRLEGVGPEIWTGSHLDTVPDGGRFDGALGVVAGLEAVARLGPGGRKLAVVAFRDEEGAQGRGCAGSNALIASGVPLPDVFVEAHIEQGPVLALAGAPLGVVTGIVGTARGEVTFTGAAGHAGTTPMEDRRDALWEAAEFVLRVREAARSVEDAVATVGRLEVEPGASNVVPARVTATVDARAPDRERLDALVAAIGVDLRLTDPVAMAAEPTAIVRAEIERLSLPIVELASGAGHDAGILALAGVPTAMIFVRSLAGGVSHCPEEESSPEDVGLCVDVLAAVLTRLAA